jgi:branched-chain amino acid transport system substrate-binding protein
MKRDQTRTLTKSLHDETPRTQEENKEKLMSRSKASTIILSLLMVLPMALASCAPAEQEVVTVEVKETVVVVATPTPAAAEAEVEAEAEPEEAEAEPEAAPLPDVIKIGVNETMTGWGAPYGDMTWKGIQLAHEHKPEVLGKPVELILVDNKSEKSESALAAQRLIDVEKVYAVIGVNSSSMAMAQNEVLDPAGIPAIGPACTNPLVTMDKPHAFRAAFIDPFQGEAAARYAVEALGAKTCVLLVDITLDYCVGLGNYFRENFIKLTDDNHSILGYFSFQTGDRDFTAQLTAIKDLNPDIVFAPNEYAEEAAILQQAQQLGLTPDIKFMAGDSCDVPELMEIAGEAANGFSYTAQFHPDGYTHPEAVKFIEGFRENYDLEPETFSVTGYDAYMILMDAIERAGSVDPEAITQALAETEFVGARGLVVFDEEGNALAPCPVIGIEDGQKIFRYLVEP